MKSATHTDRNGNKVGTSFKITSEVRRLEAFYNGLSRGKDQILLYLAEVYKTAKRMRAQKKSDVLRQLRDDLRLTLDARVSSTSYRLLIELTSKCDIKLKSRYANALMFARHMQWTSAQLQHLIAENGGIEKCARAYLRVKNGNNIDHRLA